MPARLASLPRSKGGWRKLDRLEDVRRVGGMDPDKLAAVREWLLRAQYRNSAFSPLFKLFWCPGQDSREMHEATASHPTLAVLVPWLEDVTLAPLALLALERVPGREHSCSATGPAGSRSAQ